MGKHEREAVQIAENIVNDLLNHKQIEAAHQKHELYPYAKILAEKIADKFGPVLISSHIGNTYVDTMGDLKLDLSNGRTIFVELKFLKSGTGTRANISQNSLTERGLFEGSGVLHWSDFRKQRGHEQKVVAWLNQFHDYLPGILNALGKRRFYAQARYLRDLKGKGDAAAANIMNSIADMDRNEKIAYIEHLEPQKQDYQNVKHFVFLIIAGVHKRASMAAQWNVGYQKIVDMVEQGYYACYVYKDETVLIRNWSDALRRLLDKEIYIWFPKDQTNVMIGFDDGTERIPVLRVVLHWKNIAQGIQTPCLNIFDEKYLLENL